MAVNSLSKVMSKLLRHGFPEIKKIHHEIIQYMKVDGFLPIYILLKILNGNNSIGDPVRNKLNKSRIQILDIKKIVEEDNRSRYSIQERNKILYIRANYGHSLTKIKIEKLSNILITKEFLEKNDCKIFDYFCKADIDNLIRLGLFGKNKKNLWFQIEGKDYVNVNKCEDRTKVYLKANEAIEEGYNFYLNENNFVISSGKNNMIPPKFLVVAN